MLNESELNGNNDAKIELMIARYIDKTAEKIADKCTERILNAQKDCEAWRIFSDRQNCVDFYNNKNRLIDHIECHKRQEEEDLKLENEKKVLIDRRYKLIMLFVSFISIPSFVNVIKLIISKM